MLIKSENKQATAAQPEQLGVGRYRQSLLLTLMGLAIITAYIYYRQQTNYQLDTFVTPAGWGYTILANGSPLIYQPTLPGRAGSNGFTTQEQAQRVGKWVIEKLRQGEKLPTLTDEELKKLGVTGP